MEFSHAPRRRESERDHSHSLPVLYKRQRWHLTHLNCFMHEEERKKFEFFLALVYCLNCAGTRIESWLDGCHVMRPLRYWILGKYICADVPMNRWHLVGVAGADQLGNPVNGIWPILRPKARNSIDTLCSLSLVALLLSGSSIPPFIFRQLCECVCVTHNAQSHTICSPIQMVDLLNLLHLTGFIIAFKWPIETLFDSQVFFVLYISQGLRNWMGEHEHRQTVLNQYDHRCEWMQHDEQQEKTNCIQILQIIHWLH